MTEQQDKLKHGAELARDGKVEEALAIFEEILLFSPDDADALFFQGACLFRQKNFAEARRAWERVLELNPDHPRAAGMLEKIPDEDHSGRVKIESEDQAPSPKPKTPAKKKRESEGPNPWIKRGIFGALALGVVALGLDMMSNPSSYSFLGLGGSEESSKETAAPPPTGPLNREVGAAGAKPLEQALPGRWFFKWQGNPATMAFQASGQVTVNVQAPGNTNIVMPGTFQIEGTKVVLDIKTPNPETGQQEPTKVELHNTQIEGVELRFNFQDASGPEMLAVKQ